MPVYVGTIAGTRALVFAAPDDAHALNFAADDFIRSELAALRAPNGRALLPPGAEISVQAAGAGEYKIWEAALADALKDGVFESRDDAIRHNCFEFLIAYREPDE